MPIVMQLSVMQLDPLASTLKTFFNVFHRVARAARRKQELSIGRGQNLASKVSKLDKQNITTASSGRTEAPFKPASSIKANY